MGRRLEPYDELPSAAGALLITDHKERIVGFDAAFNVAERNCRLQPLGIADDPLAQLQLWFVKNEGEVAGGFSTRVCQRHPQEARFPLYFAYV